MSGLYAAEISCMIPPFEGVHTWGRRCPATHRIAILVRLIVILVPKRGVEECALAARQKPLLRVSRANLRRRALNKLCGMLEAASLS